MKYNWKRTPPTAMRFSTLCLQWELCILQCCSLAGSLIIQHESKISYHQAIKQLLGSPYDFKWQCAYIHWNQIKTAFQVISAILRDFPLLHHLRQRKKDLITSSHSHILHFIIRWSIDVGWASTWVKIINEWFAASIYSKSCIPRCLPSSYFCENRCLASSFVCKKVLYCRQLRSC